jgi:hypothetical protein
MEEKEKNSGGKVPRGLPIGGAISLILGIIALQIIPNTFTEEQLADNVIISAIPFVLIFASIIVFFMSFVWWVSIKLGGNISEKVYRPIEYVLIGGIVLGAVMMFQSWVFRLYQVGFFVLLFALIGYIVWSHVRPRDPNRSDELAGMSDST